MNEEKSGFDKSELKKNIDRIADNAAKSSYSRPETVQRTRDLGKEMVDRS